MYKRALIAPARSFFLFGPRGSGKSTWARSEYPDAVRFDFLSQQAFFEYQRDPSKFGRQLAALPRESWLVVDEIQRLPELLNEVHRAIEEYGHRFVMLGSSSRKLKQAGVNLLAGRASLRRMFPFLPEELGEDFCLARTLSVGSIPIVWSSQEPEEVLRSYVETYLREEIQAEAVVRSLGDFVRFLPVAGLFHGQTMNVSAIARDTGVARTTVDGYLGILEDTLLAWTLPAYETRLRVRQRSHPKFYWVDPGLARAVKGRLGEVGLEERGPLVEGWVIGNVRARLSYSNSDAKLSYLSASGGTEVDLFVEDDQGLTAIEIKASGTVDSRALRGLRSIKDHPGLKRRVLVADVQSREKTEDGILICPLADDPLAL